MEAFVGAVELGYRHLETDLRVTGDGVLVCLHDPTVDRTTDGSGPVTELSFDELSSLDAGYRQDGSRGSNLPGPGIRVPMLEEAVLAFPEVSFVVDLKTENLVKPLHDLIERLGLHDRLIVGLFSIGGSRSSGMRRPAGSPRPRVQPWPGPGSWRVQSRRESWARHRPFSFPVIPEGFVSSIES